MENQSIVETNMFGGSLDHPAYSKRPLAHNEVLCGPTLYRIKIRLKRLSMTKIISVSYEEIDGTMGLCESDRPNAVKKKIEMLTS